MLAACRNNDLVRWWESQPAGLHWERITAPTERLVRILGKETIAGRLQHDHRFIQLIDAGHSYAAQGGRVCSDAELRFMLGWRLRQVLRYKREGGRRPLTIILEESEASGLLGQQEVVDLLTQRKNNVRFIIVAQNTVHRTD